MSDINKDGGLGVVTRVVQSVLKELRCRKGFNDWWDSIDEETQDELLFTLMDKAQESLSERAKR